MICGAINRCKCAIVRSNTEYFAELLETIGRARPPGAPNRADGLPRLRVPHHYSAADEKNVRGLNVWIELYVITAAAPSVIRAA
jgi:hypothetical protein